MEQSTRKLCYVCLWYINKTEMRKFQTIWCISNFLEKHLSPDATRFMNERNINCSCTFQGKFHCASPEHSLMLQTSRDMHLLVNVHALSQKSRRVQNSPNSQDPITYLSTVRTSSRSYPTSSQECPTSSVCSRNSGTGDFQSSWCTHYVNVGCIAGNTRIPFTPEKRWIANFPWRLLSRNALKEDQQWRCSIYRCGENAVCRRCHIRDGFLRTAGAASVCGNCWHDRRGKRFVNRFHMQTLKTYQFSIMCCLL